MNEVPGRVQYRCRRGLLELDVLFERFLQSQYATLTEEEQQQFEALLDYPDTIILDWFVGNVPLDETPFPSVVAKLQKLSNS